MNIFIDIFELVHNHVVMEQSGYTINSVQNQANLDAVFHALADPTRRAILARLTDGQASVKELTAPFAISQPAISRHLKVLQQAGLIEREIDQQRRLARLNADNMAAAAGWLNEFRAFWGKSFDQLDVLLNTLKTEEHNTKNTAD